MSNDGAPEPRDARINGQQWSPKPPSRQAKVTSGRRQDAEAWGISELKIKNVEV